jgi:glycine oxidase
MNRHVVVVGGGVIGLSIAWQAAHQKFDVTLIDRARIGGEASWARWTASYVTCDGSASARRLSAASHALHAEWYPQIRAQSGIDYEYEVAGTVHLARSRAEKASPAGLNSVAWRN